MLDNRDFEKIKQIRKDRRDSHSIFQKKLKSYKSFSELKKVTFDEGILGKRIKELMAMSIE